MLMHIVFIFTFLIFRCCILIMVWYDNVDCLSGLSCYLSEWVLTFLIEYLVDYILFFCVSQCLMIHGLKSWSVSVLHSKHWVCISRCKSSSHSLYLSFPLLILFSKQTGRFSIACSPVTPHSLCCLSKVIFVPQYSVVLEGNRWSSLKTEKRRERICEIVQFASCKSPQSHCTKISASGHVLLWY